jgi:hypothetical protein
MLDLNDFVPDDYADHLFTANDINNLGQITGFTLKAGTQDALAFWALPTEKRGPRGDDANSVVAKNAAKPLLLPAEVRHLILARAGAMDAQLGQ